MKTYSLESAVAQICGDDSGMTDPRGWLLRGIRSGRFEARKVGRHYRMTAEQIDAAIEIVTTKPAKTVEHKARGLSLTATSARRLKAVAR
jgi:hypothetical protein